MGCFACGHRHRQVDAGQGLILSEPRGSHQAGRSHELILDSWNFGHDEIRRASLVTSQQAMFLRRMMQIILFSNIIMYFQLSAQRSIRYLKIYVSQCNSLEHD